MKSEIDDNLYFSEQYQEKPELIGPHPLNTTVDYGQQASLQCKVKSLIEPHIQVRYWVISHTMLLCWVVYELSPLFAGIF